MTREVCVADSVYGPVSGEDVPFLVDEDARPRFPLDEPEVLEVDARMVDEVADIVMREAGVLARCAEEASPDGLNELLVLSNAFTHLVCAVCSPLGGKHGLSDFAECHFGARERVACSGAVAAFGALTEECPVCIATFKQAHELSPPRNECCE